MIPAVVERVEQVVDAPRRRHPGRVAEREPVGTRVDEMPGDLRHPLGRDVAFVRAPERGRHDRLDRYTRAVADLHHVARADQRVGHRPPHVLLVVRLARAHDELDLVGPGRGTASSAPFGFGTSAEYTTPGRAGDPGHHLARAGHRRDRGGRHERRGLDEPQPGRRQRVDQADPLPRRERRLVLQPVARADFSDVDMGGPIRHADHVTRPAPPVRACGPARGA